MAKSKKDSMPVYPIKKQHDGKRPPDVRDNLDSRSNIEQTFTSNGKSSSNKKNRKNQSAA